MSHPPHAARPIRLLLVEDSKTQRVLVQNAVRESESIALQHAAEDGEEALDYLRGRGSGVPAARPDLILLDLNMPRKNGFEFLDEIKEDEDLRNIPVILFTTSDCEDDVAHSYASGASAFMNKPSSYAELQLILEDIGKYWGHVRLPPTRQANHASSLC